MSSKKKDRISRADLWKIWVPIALLIVVGFALAIASLDPPPPSHLKIATGSTEGAYFSFGETYRNLMAKEGFDLEVLPTAGSEENLRLLRSGEVDLALVQGGTASASSKDPLQSLASIFLEPVWLFHRKDIEVSQLKDLLGRRIAVGEEGSGTRALALRLLEKNGLSSENGSILEISAAQAADALAAGTADAAFFVASIEASYIGRLLRDPELRLFSFARHRAYRRFFPFLSHLVLGEGVFDLDRNLPAQDVSLLASAASLVGRSDLHDGLIPLLFEMMRATHGSEALFSLPGEFPSSRFVELPMNPEARLYIEQGPSFLHRILPFRAATAIDRLKILLLPFITLLIPLFRVAPPLYRWRIRSRIYRWYEDLHEVDQLIHGAPSAEEIETSIEKVRLLEREVAQEVSVPLSYMDEYYRLRDHIDLVLRKLGVSVPVRALRADDESPT